MKPTNRNLNASYRSHRDLGRSLAMAALLASMLLPLSGCLTPENPYKLSPTELDATGAGQKLAFETLRQNGGEGEEGEAGEGGGDAH